jgi:hypothetical protein
MLIASDRNKLEAGFSPAVQFRGSTRWYRTQFGAPVFVSLVTRTSANTAGLPSFPRMLGRISWPR